MLIFKRYTAFVVFKLWPFPEDGCPLEAKWHGCAIGRKEGMQGGKKITSFLRCLRWKALWNTAGLTVIHLSGIKTEEWHFKDDAFIAASYRESIYLFCGNKRLQWELLTGESWVTDTFEGGGRHLNARPVFANSVTVLSPDDFRAVNPWNEDQLGRRL